jgi:hypothetical protein
MKLWKTAIVLFVFVSSCSIQPKPKLQITHVLAVTQQGDTLTIPIDVIRPINYKIINYSGGYNYNWARPYYHYQYDNYSRGSSYRSNNNNSNNNSNVGKIVPREDPGDGKPSADVLMKGKK